MLEDLWYERLSLRCRHLVVEGQPQVTLRRLPLLARQPVRHSPEVLPHAQRPGPRLPSNGSRHCIEEYQHAPLPGTLPQARVSTIFFTLAFRHVVLIPFCVAWSH